MEPCDPQVKITGFLSLLDDYNLNTFQMQYQESLKRLKFDTMYDL